MEFVEPLRTQEELDAMYYYFKNRSERDFLLFYMGINVAFRISDLLKSKVGDVRGRDKIKRREMKTGKMREIDVLPQLKDVLDEYCEGKDDEEYLFKSTRYKNSNRPITRTQAYRIIRAGAKECGIRFIGTHSFRKTFGYHYYKDTKDIVTLMQLFNHTDPSITLRYVGIERDETSKKLRKWGGVM